MLLNSQDGPLFFFLPPPGFKAKTEILSSPPSEGRQNVSFPILSVSG